MSLENQSKSLYSYESSSDDDDLEKTLVLAAAAADSVNTVETYNSEKSSIENTSSGHILEPPEHKTELSCVSAIQTHVNYH